MATRRKKVVRRSAYRSGWRSTKLHVALILTGLLTFVYGMMGFPVEKLDAYILGLTSFGALYVTTRTAESFAPRNHGPTDPPPVV